MAYRFYCEQSHLLAGLVVVGQAWFDPYVGFYDYANDRVPSGTPQCSPTHKRPVYSAVGTRERARAHTHTHTHTYARTHTHTLSLSLSLSLSHTHTQTGEDDEYYGAGAGSMEAVANWESLSTQILGCTGSSQQASHSLALTQGEVTCYEFAWCDVTAPSLNRMCSVAGAVHDGSLAGPMINSAFRLLFTVCGEGEYLRYANLNRPLLPYE